MVKDRQKCAGKQKERRITHKHNYDAYLAVGVLSFPIIALLISPFVHEMCHVAVLSISGCEYYWVDVHSPIDGGIGATIETHCDFTMAQLSTLYLSGIAGTMIIGLLILSLDWHLTKRDYHEYSVLAGFVAMGFMFSPTLYFIVSEGDLINTLEIFDLEQYSGILPFIGSGIIVFLIYHLWRILRYSLESEIDEELEESCEEEDKKKYMPGFKAE